MWNPRYFTATCAKTKALTYTSLLRAKKFNPSKPFTLLLHHYWSTSGFMCDYVTSPNCLACKQHGCVSTVQPLNLWLSSSQANLSSLCLESSLEIKSICLETFRNQHFIGTNIIHTCIFSVYRAFELSLTSLFCSSLQQNTSERKTF